MYKFRCCVCFKINRQRINFNRRTENCHQGIYVDRKHIFAVLPTWFGKSVTYQLAPIVAKKMGCNEKLVVVVVSPLVKEYQVKELATLVI